MDPFADQPLEYDRRAARHLAKLVAQRAGAKPSPTRIVLPKKRPLPHRDEMARTLGSMRELAEYVGEIRAGLEIPQAQLAARAGVSRQWLVALEQGRPTVEAGKVLRTLEALGFELVVVPYDKPPPWMLRAVRAAQERRETVAKEARRRRAGKRKLAKLSRLAGSVTGMVLDLG